MLPPTFFILELPPGADPGGGNSGDCPPPKTKITLFTVILYNPENRIHDIPVRPFCRPLFCQTVKAVLWSTRHLSYSSEDIIGLDYQMFLKSPPLKLLVGPAPVLNEKMLLSTQRRELLRLRAISRHTWEERLIVKT